MLHGVAIYKAEEQLPKYTELFSAALLEIKEVLTCF